MEVGEPINQFDVNATTFMCPHPSWWTVVLSLPVY